jgi:hypothetical protein
VLLRARTWTTGAWTLTARSARALRARLAIVYMRELMEVKRRDCIRWVAWRSCGCGRDRRAWMAGCEKGQMGDVGGLNLRFGKCQEAIKSL